MSNIGSLTGQTSGLPVVELKRNFLDKYMLMRNDLTQKVIVFVHITTSVRMEIEDTILASSHITKIDSCLKGKNPHHLIT
jgi:hypothetical protein